MPPKGGKRAKRNKKNTSTEGVNRHTPFAEQGQMYAVATAMLGNRRLMAKCADGNDRLVIIPGKFKGRRNWISVGMTLLLNIREYQDEKADVIYIYDDRDVKRLRRANHLEGLVDSDEEDNCGFVFDGSGDEADNKKIASAEDSDQDIDLDDL